MLAVMNPEAGKTILQEALTSKEKYGVVSEDPFAGKKYGFINERDQTVNGKPINAQGDAIRGGSGLRSLTWRRPRRQACRARLCMSICPSRSRRWSRP
jgi:hypothetical protein